jgi:hypothetical protein
MRCVDTLHEHRHIRRVALSAYHTDGLALSVVPSLALCVLLNQFCIPAFYCLLCGCCTLSACAIHARYKPTAGCCPAPLLSAYVVVSGRLLIMDGQKYRQHFDRYIRR